MNTTKIIKAVRWLFQRGRLASTEVSGIRAVRICGRIFARDPRAAGESGLLLGWRRVTNLREWLFIPERK